VLFNTCRRALVSWRRQALAVQPRRRARHRPLGSSGERNDADAVVKLTPRRPSARHVQPTLNVGTRDQRIFQDAPRSGPRSQLVTDTWSHSRRRGDGRRVLQGQVSRRRDEGRTLHVPRVKRGADWLIAHITPLSFLRPGSKRSALKCPKNTARRC